MAQTTRVVLNRKAFDAIDLGLADGLFEIAVKILDTVVVPDDVPYGEGLVQGGGAIAYLGGKKVAGTTIGGRQVKKPRDFHTNATEAAVAVGFGFPARFVELGTVHARAHPFFSRAVMEVAGSDAEVILSEAMQRRLRGERAPNTAGISARIHAAKAAKAVRLAAAATKKANMKSLRAALRASAKAQGH